MIMLLSKKIIVSLLLSVACLTPLQLSAENFQILTEEFPPYNYQQDGKVLGISTEITREIIKRLGHPDNIQIKPWAEAYKQAQQENNIIIFSTTRTRTREKLFKWVGPLVPNNTVLFARKNSNFSIKSLEDAKKVKSIGVYQDDFGELLLKSNGFENLQSVLDNWQNVTRLVNGEIDLWIANELTGKYMAKELDLTDQIEKIYDVQEDYMYLAFSKSTDDKIIKKWQKALDEMHADGTYVQIFSPWLTISKASWTPSRELIIALLTIIGLVIIIAIVIWNRMLINKVEQRTFELNKSLKISEQLRKKADKAQRDAEQANKAKSEFLASMSHEIRTPMNAIIGMADLISGTQLSKEQQEYVSIFQNAGENLLNIINNILDISKIESGHLSFEVVPFDLHELVGRVGELMAVKAHKNGLELSYQIQEEVPIQLMGDSTRLQQILINLIGNAIKFTSEGEIVLRIEKNKNYAQSPILLFSVSDTGTGIPADKKGIIFDNFSQADSSTTRKYGGTGLGLAICKKLVTRMGGEIWVDKNPQGGSIFYFTIKVELQSKEYIDNEFSRQRDELNGLHILVVDDNKTNRIILREMLLSWGIVVVEVDCGLGALEAIKKSKSNHEPFDIVLLDGHMPGMDGFEVVERLKNDQGVLDIIVSMLTSDDLDEHVLKAKQLGVHSYMVKPIKKYVLYKHIIDSLSSNEYLLTADQKQPQAEVKMPAVPSLNILLVDDDPVNRKIATIMLQSQQHQVTAVIDGKSAIKAIKADHYDLVFMDVNMQEMDGYEATRIIRDMENGTTGHLPIIALTALVFKDDRQKCLDAGMDLFISKPFRNEDMAKVIFSLFSDSTLRSELSGKLSSNPINKDCSINNESVKVDKIIDRVNAFARVGNNWESLQEIVEIYLKYSEEQLLQLKNAIQAGNIEKIKNLAHTIKGSVGTLGSVNAFESAYNIEKAGKDEDFSNMDKLYDKLNKEIKIFNHALTIFVEKRQL